jgi:transposase-like protein
MNDKARLITDKKQCPYCDSNNVTYLGYFVLRKNHEIKGDDSKEKTHDFKCEDCKRIFYYRGVL